MGTERLAGLDSARLYAANAAAAAFYAGRLPAHEPALRYLAARGIAGVAGAGMPWQLGYAPARGWSSLEHLRAAGFTDRELVEAGLAHPRRGGGIFALFHDRVMFPIHDERSRVIGFTARNLGPHGPRYLNTPGTAIYHKSQSLYGLGPLLRHPPPGSGRPLVVIVEGAADALAVRRMAAADARPEATPIHPVATCGTRLTPAQLALLARNLPAGSDLAVAFDGDAAGRRAAGRAYLTTARWPGRRFGIELPDGQDPATMLAAATEPVAALHALLAGLRPLSLIRLEHAIDELLAYRRITDPLAYPQDRVRVYRAVAELFVDDPRNYRLLLDATASRLGAGVPEVVHGIVAALS